MEMYLEIISTGVMLCGVSLFLMLVSKWLFACVEESRVNTIKQLKKELQTKEDTITCLRACINKNEEVYYDKRSN